MENLNFSVTESTRIHELRNSCCEDGNIIKEDGSIVIRPKQENVDNDIEGFREFTHKATVDTNGRSENLNLRESNFDSMNESLPSIFGSMTSEHSTNSSGASAGVALRSDLYVEPIEDTSSSTTLPRLIGESNECHTLPIIHISDYSETIAQVESDRILNENDTYGPCDSSTEDLGPVRVYNDLEISSRIYDHLSAIPKSRLYRLTRQVAFDMGDEDDFGIGANILDENNNVIL